MELEQYFDFVGPDDIKLKGHRIGIEHIVELYHSGYSPEQIGQAFPGLELEAVYATITYYLHNRVETDAYIHRQEEVLDSEYNKWLANPSPLVERLRKVEQERNRRSA